MGVAFGVVGQAVVDDVGQVVHVQSAGGDIGCHQQLQVADAELLHHGVALRLAQFAVQGVGVVALLHQFVGYLLRLLAGAAEDDGVYLRVVVHDALQGGVFVLGMHAVGYVVHVGGAFVLASDGDFLGIVQVVLRDAGYLGAHGGGEEQRVALLRHIGEDGVDAVGEAHVQHLVRFVHDDVLDGGERYGLAFHQVE